jgi:hypothetical protein
LQTYLEGCHLLPDVVKDLTREVLSIQNIVTQHLRVVLAHVEGARRLANIVKVNIAEPRVSLNLLCFFQSSSNVLL